MSEDGKADEKADEKVVANTATTDEQNSEDSAEEIVYPKGIKLVIIITALSLAVLLVALDQTIIATAIPRITDRFQSVRDIGWYGSAYFLTATSLQPTFGRIYKTFSVKGTFLAAIGVFELGSLICAVAPSSTVLIIGRAIAGIGVGGIFSGAVVISAYARMWKTRSFYHPCPDFNCIQL
jgi:MFS family permease